MYGKWLWLKRARMSYFWIKRAYASIECRCDLIRCLNCRFFPSLSPFLSPVRSVACEPFYDVHTFRNMLKIVDVYVCIALIVMMMCLCYAVYGAPFFTFHILFPSYFNLAVTLSPFMYIQKHLRAHGKFIDINYCDVAR